MKPEKIISLKTPEEIELLRRCGGVLAAIVKELKCSLKIGMTTKEVDQKVEELIKKHNALSAFQGYRGFPGCSCISVNQQVVHGIPGSRVIQAGDIVSIDVGIVLNKYFSDTAFTMGFGKISPEKEKLLDVAQQALYKGIEQATVEHHVSDISYAIQNYVEAHNFTVVRDFVGHGIGRELHEEPEIPNFGPPHEGPLLKEGMVLAIEPMVNSGTWQTQTLEDGWTVVTKDGKPSAHFEHTIAVTKSGPEILTKENNNLFFSLCRKKI